MLEPYAGKLACTVLRGGGGRKASNLPGQLKKLKTLKNVLVSVAYIIVGLVVFYYLYENVSRLGMTIFEYEGDAYKIGKKPGENFSMFLFSIIAGPGFIMLGIRNLYHIIKKNKDAGFK